MASDDLKRAGVDLNQIIQAVLVTPRPADVPVEKEGGWRWGWLMYCVWGYCQTELGVDPPDADMSTWREDASEVGISTDWTHHLRGADRARAGEQRRLYAEAMAPKLAQRMLDGMKEAPDAE